MSIDLEHEELLPLGKLTKYVPKRRGKRVSASSLWRWIRFGCKGVKMEGLRTPAGWCSTREALQRYMVRLADINRNDGVSVAENDRRREELRRLNARAEAALKGIGLA